MADSLRIVGLLFFCLLFQVLLAVLINPISRLDYDGLPQLEKPFAANEAQPVSLTAGRR
jgi:hypothetical protein